MKTRLKIALTVAVVMAAVFALSRAFDWMNRPSDLWFWLGLIGALQVLVIAPAAVTLIWRPRLLR